MASYEGTSDQRYGCTTYAHCGEDIMVCNLFELMQIERPSFIDLGAHHPFHLSNTALLYGRGSRGFNIEANPKLMAEFFIHRPEDTNINIGISLTGGRKEFFMWDDRSGRNTFSREWADKLEVKGGSIYLSTFTLKDIVDLYCGEEYPDFMSIDIEGLDYEVLESADFSKSSPKVICLESWDTPKFKRMMESQGYTLYSRHNVDLIFVRNDLYPKCF